MKTHSGFSLIELMVALAIAAVLAALAAPSFTRMLAQNRLGTQANDLIGAVQFARAEAIKRRQPVTLCPSASQSSNACSSNGNWPYWIVIDDPTDGSSPKVLRQGMIQGQASGSLDISSTLSNSKLTFRSDGQANVSKGADAIRICDTGDADKNIRLLTIGIIGRVTITTQSGNC